MGKTKTSVRQKKSSVNMLRKKKINMKMRKGTGIRRSDPTKELIDEELIGKAIWECLKNGDPEGIVEVIRIYLDAVNKMQVAREGAAAKTSLHSNLRSRNPTVKTLAKLVHQCV